MRGREGRLAFTSYSQRTDAADQIPKDARGRFITGDGTVFQGYLFDESVI